MNRALLIMAAALWLAACGKPASIESVESLVANPERLKELRAACKADHTKIGDPQCNAVAEATRRRFFGSGGPKYTPPASAAGGLLQDDAHRTPAPAPASSAPPPVTAPKE